MSRKIHFLQNERGNGKPLGHKRSLNFTNLLKIKRRCAGKRVVYKLMKTASQMLVIIA